MKKLSVIFAAPDHRVAPDLLLWLVRHGFTETNTVFVNESRDRCVAFNSGVKFALENSAFGEFVFCENDMHPGSKTDEFFSVTKYAVQCVKYPTEGEHAWSSPESFHKGIWRTNRKSLEAMQRNSVKTGIPFFRWHATGDGAMILGCSCASLAQHARDCSLSIGHVGQCGHFPRSPSKIPGIVQYDLQPKEEVAK